MDNRFKEPHSHPRWWWEGSYIPACFHCKHFQGVIKGKVCCKAFENGIPNDLLKEGAFHNSPFQGDHGIQFEPFQEQEV